MPKIDRIFNGIMDLDTDAYRVSGNNYIGAINITRDAAGSGQDSVITNINGNQQIAYTLPSGFNKCIGGYGDKLRNRLYYWIYNSNGFHSILYYSGTDNNVIPLLISKTDSDGIDILNFNQSYRVLSINIIYLDSGDIVFFNDGFNPPRNINTNVTYGTSWKSEYLKVIKQPPQMPPKCVYENDTTISVNNLRNALFQFRYRYVYADNDKSVWGSAGSVPLPFQPSNNLTAYTFTNNSRISLSMSTGGKQVKKIEIAVRQSSNGVTSSWLLVGSFVKSELSLSDNDIFTHLFYNDGIYTTIDVKDIDQLQDYVPQLADAAELLNGSNLIYGSITEGYDKVNVDMSIVPQAASVSSFFYEYNGTLLFATINAIDSGSQGTTMKVYLYGTGTNTTGSVTTLNNGAANYVVNAENSSGTLIGGSFLNSSDNPTVASILTGLSASLVSNGWTQVSLGGNILTMSFPTTATILSSGTKTTGVGNASPTNSATTHFKYPWQSAYSVAPQYFDIDGRTNGVSISAGSYVTLPVDNGGNMSPQVVINSRPPLWAAYYQLVRAPNLTYNYRLDWVTNGAYSDANKNILGVRYAYLEIDNIQQYNQQIQSTEGIVGYEFQQGDRVRIFGRFDATGTPAAINAVYDYEILGTVQSFVLNGIVKIGNYLKILYPTADIDSNFKFDGASNFLNYEILVYNYVKHASDTNQLYYEFNRCFGIGNAGTSNAFHIGWEQTQTADLGTPAKISIANGDLFSKQRTVPVGQSYQFDCTGATFSALIARPVMNLTSATSPVTNSAYTIQTCTGATSSTLLPGDYTSSAAYFLNLTSNPISVRVRSTVPVSTDGQNAISLLSVAVNSDTTINSVVVLPNTSIVSGTSYNYVVDSIIIVQGNGHLQFIIENLGTVSNLTVRPFAIQVDVIDNVTIEAIESSFSDIYAIITNSNGRPSAIEPNTVRAKYPTLVRFGGSYLQDTTVNNTNRFSFDDTDEYNRIYGQIQRLLVLGSYMKVFQQFKIGDVPVLIQIVQDTAGNPLQAQSDRLINKIHYYQLECGIGFSPASLAWNNYAAYGVDDVRGIVWRLSQDGLIALSITYKTNAFFTDKLRYFRTDLNNGIVPIGQIYSGNPTVVGVFDPYTNKYIIALEEINRYSETPPHPLTFHQDPYTIVFSETRDTTEGFESFISYHPEMMAVLNTSLATFQNGNIWIHNSDTYCNFYGTQYECSVTLVFNDANSFKKTFLALVETGTITWVAPSITTSMNSHGTTKQQSELKDWNFKTLEGTYNATFLRDSNSTGGLINGGSLKGEYIIIKLQVNSDKSGSLVALNSVSVKFIESFQNSR